MFDFSEKLRFCVNSNFESQNLMFETNDETNDSNWNFSKLSSNFIHANIWQIKNDLENFTLKREMNFFIEIKCVCA